MPLAEPELNTADQQPSNSNLLYAWVYLLKAMRPNHWIKNMVVFAAPLFAFQLDWGSVLSALLAFTAFSFTASSIYLINDVMDVKADREHPVKCKRPIAAGLVSVPTALMTAMVLLAGSLLLSYLVAPLLSLIIGAYAILQIAYNLGLKYKTIVDIMCISTGFVLRALGGAAATHVMPSSWFVLCIGLLALYLGIEKRKAELKSLGNTGITRSVLQFYSLPWLTRMESIVTATALMAYALWTIEGAQTQWMMVTIPFVIYAIFKYQYLSELGQGETPEETLIKSPHILGAIILWALTSALVLLAQQGALLSV